MISRSDSGEGDLPSDRLASGRTIVLLLVSPMRLEGVWGDPTALLLANKFRTRDVGVTFSPVLTLVGVLVLAPYGLGERETDDRFIIALRPSARVSFAVSPEIPKASLFTEDLISADFAIQTRTPGPTARRRRHQPSLLLLWGCLIAPSNCYRSPEQLIQLCIVKVITETVNGIAGGSLRCAKLDSFFGMLFRVSLVSSHVLIHILLVGIVVELLGARDQVWVDIYRKVRYRLRCCLCCEQVEGVLFFRQFVVVASIT